MKKTCHALTPACSILSRAVTLLFIQLFWALPLLAQQIPLTGVVKNAKGETLKGVSVNVKGTSTGTTTNDQGIFSLNVPNENATLVFSFVGHATLEQPVGKKRTFNIELKEGSGNPLDEVVVIGYGGSMRKRDVGGSIASVGKKQIAERQPVTLFDALQGQAAGVLVTNDNGDPAAQGTIQIRGASTINSGNGPLYVIDGVLSENGNFVNPADMESIEILKDAASVSIYGARGANGVIIITTKKGKDGKPQVNLGFNHVMGKLAHKLRTTTADELREYRRLRGDGNGGYNADSTNPYLNADNDYQDLLFRTANKDVVSMSIGGGQKGGANYYGSLNYTDDRSIVINSWIKRIQSKINVGYNLNKKLQVSHSLAFSYQTGNNIPVGTSARQVFERNPWTSIYKPDGSLASYVESKRNPVAYALINKDNDNDYLIQLNTTISYQILPDLKFTTLINGQLENLTNKSFTSSYLTSGGTGDATGSNEFRKRFYWEAQGYFNYKKTIGEHDFTGLLGVSADRRRTDGYLISMYRYLSEDINVSNAGIVDLTKTRTSATANADASIFARAGYNYAGKYILQASARRDGSSRFGPANKWGTFFSGSAAWRFSQEKFMDWAAGFISDAKLRYSVGQSGNDRVGDYPSYSTMDFGQQFYNGQSAASESLVLGNPDVKWETTTASNWGIEISALKNRVNLTVEYYIKKTHDLLYNFELPKESGKSAVVKNLGDIKNVGWEFTLQTTPVAGKNFSLDLGGNLSLMKGTIERLVGNSALIDEQWLIREGGKIGDFYLWKNLGVYAWNESNAYNAQGERLNVVLGSDGKPNGSYTDGTGKNYTGQIFSKYRNGFKLLGGDTEWQDVNNDGEIDDYDKVIAGNAIPDFFFGVNTTIRYKNLSLYVLFNGQIGNDIYNLVRADQNRNNSTYSPPIWDMIKNAWWKAGDEAIYPNVKAKDDRGGMSYQYNSLYVEDGSFIRLTSARLNYMLPSEIARKWKLNNASIFLYGTNLLTWTNYSWYDPEFSGDGLRIGLDNGKYPKRREIGMGINVNF
ncbi:MAG: TonB-dependent receptor [Chitinophagaceae bacterium]|nr:TonB-dependent receptor [Chitinophagaceae bacterium]